MTDGGTQITTTLRDGVPWVTVRGGLDVTAVDELDRELDGMAAASMTLDLRGVTFMDSSGLALLIDRASEARSAGNVLTIAPSDAVEAVLDLAQVAAEWELLDG